MDDVIQLKNVTHRYQLGRVEVEALRGIELTVRRGEFVALVGPSGSGKSTLLNLLGGLDKVTEGEVWVQNVPLHTASEHDLTMHRRWQVGFIFQRFNLLPRLTALENVALSLMMEGVSRQQRNHRASEILKQVGLGHRLGHHPPELSGGEQQRTAIARALVKSPALVLADEPTGNLDSVTGAEVMGLLHELNREHGVTLVVVTHDPEVAAYAGRIVHLRDGTVSEIVEKAAPTPAVSPSNPPAPPHSGGPNRGGFSLRDLFGTAFDNLSRRPVRNLLTATGVLVGIVTLVAMVSFGVGVQAEVRRNFEALGLENIFVGPTFSQADEFDPLALPRPEQPLTPDLVTKIATLPDVAAVTPRLSLAPSEQTSVTWGETAVRVRISDSIREGAFGPPSQADMLAGEELGEGITSGAVLSAGLADRLLVDGEATYRDLIGDTATLTVLMPRGDSQQFEVTIIGVRDGFSSRAIDLGVIERAEIKAWQLGRPDILNIDGYDALIVRAVNLSAVDGVTEAIEARGRFQVQSLEAVLAVANQVFAILQALLGSVGGLALLVAALGVANTMMMAIYERTREIGMLKALGAAPHEVRRLFTAESALLGLLGGVAGLILGALLGRLVDWIGHQYLISEGVTGVGQLSVVPPWLAIGAVIFATLIGILAGLYPAARAARLDPVAALRHE